MKENAQPKRMFALLMNKWWHRWTGETAPDENSSATDEEATSAAGDMATDEEATPAAGGCVPNDEREQTAALLRQLVSQNAAILERLNGLEARQEAVEKKIAAGGETTVGGRAAASVEIAKPATGGETAKPAVKEKAGSQARYDERQQALLRPVHDMAAFVKSNYEFRHNVVRDTYEYRRKTDDDGPKGDGSDRSAVGGAKTDGDGWQMVDKRQLNTINCSVQDDGEIFCLSSFVKQRVESGLATDYHPIRAYLDSVRGAWDGQDHVGSLARRINGSGYCERMMRKWLRAVVAQWLGCDSEHANAVMLLLVSERQGLHKSTFLRALLPPEIGDYYTDDFSLSAKGNAYRKMVEYALVSIDEFDKMPRRKMPELKSMMQTLKPSFIGAYKKSFNQLPRIASFVGTSNERQLLTDRTGSRRFLILEPDGVIPVSGIDHRQLYAQLIDEVERQHLDHYFTKADEAEMEQQNRRYYVENPVERLFLNHYGVPATPGEGRLMECRELMQALARLSPKTMAGVTANQFGRYMTRLSVPRGRSHSGDGFIVCQLE